MDYIHQLGHPSVSELWTVFSLCAIYNAHTLVADANTRCRLGAYTNVQYESTRRICRTSEFEISLVPLGRLEPPPTSEWLLKGSEEAVNAVSYHDVHYNLSIHYSSRLVLRGSALILYITCFENKASVSNVRIGCQSASATRTSK